MERNLELLLAVNRLPGQRSRQKRHLMDNCRDETDLKSAVGIYADSLSPAYRSKVPAVASLLRSAAADLRRMKAFGIEVSFLGDEEYPAMLAGIYNPPFALFRRGIVDFTGKSAVAVVGTRRPTITAMRQGFRIALELAIAGYPVVSGMAFGIDRSAHDGALSVQGTTWAVLAGGLDRPSPLAHRRLAHRILDNGGALLSEIPPGMFPAKYAFPRRNRILSGLCRGCVVVQAPAKSGALITADFALEQGRDLYIATTGLEGFGSEGSRRLEEQGAPVVEDAAEILADWGRFLDIRRVRELNNPDSADDLVLRMKSELDGRLYRYMGGSFEYRGV